MPVHDRRVIVFIEANRLRVLRPQIYFSFARRPNSSAYQMKKREFARSRKEESLM